MPTRLLPILLVAALLLPATASAMPIDNGPTPQVRHDSPPPTTRTVVRTSGDGDELAIILSGVAVLLAVASAAFVTIRVPRPSRA